MSVHDKGQVFVEMKEITVLNNISKLVDKINYKSIYLEINTENNKYTLEKNRTKRIGFDTGGIYVNKS